MDFSESFLHFIWQFRLFNSAKLFSEGSEGIEVIYPGVLNKDAGPDFSEAKLIIGKTTWIGHVEIHIKSSDWLLHGHQNDPFYNSVILHVVYSNDKTIYRTDGSLIPVLVLKGLFPDRLLFNYNELINSVNAFPCEKQIRYVDQIVVESFLSRLTVERFEQKSKEVFLILRNNQGNWEQAFYHFVARNFGFKVNAVPFELLANSLPNNVFFKHKDNAVQIAALIFGQAGFLNQQFSESYPKLLQEEYRFLQKKYQLVPIDNAAWKFLRMRPQNFPTVRLAQFAALIFKTNHLFSKILKIKTLAGFYQLFSELPVDDYWKTHYHFNKPAERVIIQPGKQSIYNVIINSVCLFLFAYGKYTDQPFLVERSLDFLGKIPPESNARLTTYIDAGLKPDCAFISQGILQLNKMYCSRKKCLNCGIGIKILKK